jgi:DNA-binding transcriptional ArsR family regulator
MLNNAAVDRVFHALAEPTRRAIVERLTAGPLSVSELAKPFDMTLAAVVQHLQVLEQSGVVRSEKVGRVRTCRIDSGGLAVAERWLSERRALWERRFDILGDVLAEEERAPSRPIKPSIKPSKQTRKQRKKT